MATQKNTNNKKEEIEEKNLEETLDNLQESVVEKEEINVKENKHYNTKKHPVVNFSLIVLLIASLISFGLNILDKDKSIYELITSLILTLFTIFFVTISISYHRKSKGTVFISCIILLCYFGLDILTHSSIITSPIIEEKNFQGKSVTEVMKWASKNNIEVNQEYEYSDMISEYKVISQEIVKDNKKIKAINIAISEGPNPDKEIVVPSMISWDDERVINYIKDNYLNNVIVDFISSDKAKDTVIEQSATGNLKRSDEIKLVFSYGEELGFDSVKLIDFTNKSKFEVEFFMKQHQLNYEFNDAFSNKIKRGFATKQSIKAGQEVKINDENVLVTISKGPKIKIPDLTKMNLESITDWAIKNKVKLMFSDQYDAEVEENSVIGFNYEKGDIVEEGTTIKVIISRGALKMPKFNNVNEFYDWANKYGIKYEEKHEFSNTIKAGEIIKFSYKAGDKIKNNDMIIVTISDGNKQTVPNVVGLTKSEAISKLEKANLKYSFIYKSSNSTKNKVIDQSISAGSEVSKGTTITVTLSNGKGEENKVEERRTTNNNSSSNTNSNSNTNNNNNKPSTNPTPTPTPKPSCTSEVVYIYDELISNVASTTCSKIKSAYPNLKFSCSYVQNSGLSNGMLQNAGSVDGTTRSSCETISLIIVNN